MTTKAFNSNLSSSYLDANANSPREIPPGIRQVDKLLYVRMLHNSLRNSQTQTKQKRFKSPTSNKNPLCFDEEAAKVTSEV